MALTPQDRDLLKRCLGKAPGSWNDFVDRYLGLIFHVIRHTAHLRSMPLGPEDVEDLAAEVLLQVVADDYHVLREFRGNCSLATYLTIIARRISVQELARKAAAREVLPKKFTSSPVEELEEVTPPQQGGLETLEEVAKLLRKLPSKERRVVRLHYLEGRSYEEISTMLKMPINSIGPILSRARKRMRDGVKSPPNLRKVPRSDDE